MREHIGLYRGKRKDNGEWVEGFYISCLAAAHYIIPCYTGGYEAMDNSFYVHKWYEVDPDTVGECCGGLTDKNGKLIFEGDILECCTERIVEVKFGQHWDDEQESVSYGWYVSDNEGTLSLDMNWNDHKIIGNIHDNPELLGGGDNG